jgi:hypothetical protein
MTTYDLKIDLLKVAETIRKNKDENRFHDVFEIEKDRSDKLLNFNPTEAIFCGTHSGAVLSVLQFVLETAETDEEAVYMMYTLFSSITKSKELLKKTVNLLSDGI